MERIRWHYPQLNLLMLFFRIAFTSNVPRVTTDMEIEHDEIEEVEPSLKTDDFGGSRSNLHCKSESFKQFRKGLEEIDVVAEEKCSWLRSQLIGAGVEFDTPFGKRILTYADHTATSRSLRYIETFIMENVLPFYGNTHTSDSYVGGRTTEMMTEASAYIKRCMGGGPNDLLLFCGSGTTAAIKRLQEMMGIAVPSTMREKLRRCLRNEERWVVFVGPYEHHSNLLSWRQSLAEVVEIGCDSEGLVDMGRLKNELESSEYSNRPMMGSFSACSNVTGINADTRAICRLLHLHGAFACFDFAASGPYTNIDMRSGEEDGYDAVFLSPHKFVGGPGSPGVLLVSKALYQLGSSPPSTCGGGTVAYVNGFNEKDTLYYDDIEQREDAGTPPIVQKIRAALAFWIKEFMGSGLIDSLDRRHIQFALKRLHPNPSIHVLGNASVRRHSILSFLVCNGATSSLNDMERETTAGRTFQWAAMRSNEEKPLHGRFVAKLLNDLFGIQARGGCACSGPYGHYLLNVDETLSLAIRSAIQEGYEGVKPGWSRVSFSYYMPKEEVDFVLTAIEFLSEYGHCFLPLYSFNWRSGDWSFRKSMYPAVSILLNGRSIVKHELYLEIAKDIANANPYFPLKRKVPKDIDRSIVLFRI